MSTATATASTVATTGSAGTAPHLSFPRLIRSEWIKLWTVRSTVWTIALTVIGVAGISALFALAVQQSGASGDGPTVDGGAVDIFGFSTSFAQIAVVVLGILTITGEYTTGMIRTTLTAAPTRLPALWAKVIVLTGVVFVTGVISMALSYVATLPLLSGTGAELDLGDPVTQRVFLGVPLYLTGIALLAFALGALLRHSAAALATVLGLLLVILPVWSALPWAFFYNTSPFLPSSGQRIMQSDAMIEMSQGLGPHLTAWQGYGVLLAWVAVVLAVAAVLLRRRDA
jgi:ABC-2 type transport system permease protein